MKKIYLLLTLSLICFIGYAQTVNIPDANFKDALVNTLCVDTNGDGIEDSDADLDNDGEIQVSEAEAVLFLEVNKVFGSPPNEKISSMEGLQYFINLRRFEFVHNLVTTLDLSSNIYLEYLNGGENRLSNINLEENEFLTFLHLFANNFSNIDVSQNINLINLNVGFNNFSTLDLTANILLEKLSCINNQLTNLNVTQNVHLDFLNIHENYLVNLDLTQNINLEHLDCYRNQLTSLDLSQNPHLTYFVAWQNQLSSLNIKNENNVNLFLMRTTENPNLTCILVDDSTYANNQSCPEDGWCIDATTQYSEHCSLGLEDNNSITFVMFPNPTQNVLNIQSNEPIQSIKIYSLPGRLVEEGSNSIIDVSSLSNGVYFAQVSVEGKILTKKFIKS